MQKAVFLDRDGTINQDFGYLYKKEQFIFLPHVLDTLRKLQDKGYLLIIITNQSGIARGYYTEKDFEKLNSWMIEELNKEGIQIAGGYYCPHHPGAAVEAYRKECDCRKPKTGLFYRAQADHDIDFSQSLAIGDRLRDCSICFETECKGFVIAGEETQPTEKKGDIVFIDDIAEVLDYIK